MALQMCRICLEKGPDLTNVETGENSIGHKIAACVPEINVFIIGYPLICARCLSMLDTAYDFREKCIQTEKRIGKFFETLYLDCHDRLKKTSATGDLINNSSSMSVELSEYLNSCILKGLARPCEVIDDQVGDVARCKSVPNPKCLQTAGNAVVNAICKKDTVGTELLDIEIMKSCCVILKDCRKTVDYALNVKGEELSFVCSGLETSEQADEMFYSDDDDEETILSMKEMNTVLRKKRSLNRLHLVYCGVCQKDVKASSYMIHKKRHEKGVNRKTISPKRTTKMMNLRQKGNTVMISRCDSRNLEINTGKIKEKNQQIQTKAIHENDGKQRFTTCTEELGAYRTEPNMNELVDCEYAKKDMYATEFHKYRYLMSKKKGVHRIQSQKNTSTKQLHKLPRSDVGNSSTAIYVCKEKSDLNLVTKPEGNKKKRSRKRKVTETNDKQTVQEHITGVAEFTKEINSTQPDEFVTRKRDKPHIVKIIKNNQELAYNTQNEDEDTQSKVKDSQTIIIRDTRQSKMEDVQNRIVDNQNKADDALVRLNEGNDDDKQIYEHVARYEEIVSEGDLLEEEEKTPGKKKAVGRKRGVKKTNKQKEGTCHEEAGEGKAKETREHVTGGFDGNGCEPLQEKLKGGKERGINKHTNRGSSSQENCREVQVILANAEIALGGTITEIIPCANNESQFFEYQINNLCEICNVMFDNVGSWKQHIQDHIFTF